MRKFFIIMIINLMIISLLFFILPLTLAQKTGHITLLAVSEATQIGSAADLTLKILKGTGGVYIETSPLTKLDTQLSTRFAQQIACDFLDKACTDIDFFYTVRSDATIIGGPSAGAAIAALTIAMIDNLNMNQSVTVTGTINVGGLIGPVAGLIGKIDAAKTAGVTKVLIPKGTRFNPKLENTYNDLLTNTTALFYIFDNETGQYEIDLYEYGKQIGIEVKEVATLQEAMDDLTGKEYTANEAEIVPEDWYATTMATIAQNLCQRQNDLFQQLEQQNWSNGTIQEVVFNITRRAENATAYDQYYVAASTCFGGNIYLQSLLLDAEQMNATQLSARLVILNTTLVTLQKTIDAKELQTITDLQTYLVVNERLDEARQTLAEITALLALDTDALEMEYELAYAIERLYSAESWMTFFDTNGKKLKLDKAALADSCARKLAEAQERYQYVKLITEEPLQKIVSYLDTAYLESKKNNFIVCLDMASRAKANLDILLSLIGLRDEKTMTVLVEERLRLVKQVINKQQNKGYFPMLGYSYYEYAMFLKKEQPYSALIYSHHALEFSHSDMYFKEKQLQWNLTIEREYMLSFIIGLGLGLAVGCSFSLFFQRKKKRENMPKSI